MAESVAQFEHYESANRGFSRIAAGFINRLVSHYVLDCFFFQAEDGIRDKLVTGVQTCALPILTGLTVEEAKKAIEAHLAEFLESPEVSVDVFNYASKVYYIVGQGAGFGDTLTRVQI